MSEARANPARQIGRGRLIIVMLAGISALGSMAVHMVVPALPLIADDLTVDAHTAQQVVSFYLFGLAAGQLLAGPFVDRIGRRPVLLAGLSLYALAAMLATASVGPHSLLAARVLQAAGASAGLVTSRVMVGDIFDREEAGRRQATLMGVVLLSPAIAPVIGGFIAGSAGWRPILGLQATIGLVAVLASMRYLPESRAKGAGGPAHRLLPGYLKLFRNARFVRTGIAFSGASCALYMFLGIAPFLLIRRWGLDSEQAGFCFLAVACAGIVGTTAVGWIERRYDALLVGLRLGLAGSSTALALALIGVEHWAALILPMLLLTAGAGISGPAGIAIIIHAEEGLSGTAASLSGALQMALAGGSSTLLGLVGAPAPILLGCGMLTAYVVALLVAPRTRLLEGGN